MKKAILVLSTVLCCIQLPAQSIQAKLATAWQKFSTDSQLKSAMVSLYVQEAGTGKTIFERNAYTGMATASTLKVITAAAAYEILGKEFQYRTDFSIASKAGPGGDGPQYLIIKPSGDPTLGSWRWKNSSEANVMKRITAAAKEKGHRSIRDLRLDTTGWQAEAIPDGWIWQDIGNYYGAGAHPLNWRENQYDLLLRSSGKKLGDYAQFLRTKPALHGISITSYVRVAAKGTGDNSYIYYGTIGPANPGFNLQVRGTIPAGADSFAISGSMPDPWKQFQSVLMDTLREAGLSPATVAVYQPETLADHQGLPQQLIHTELSPTLDSIVYWFLKKSINLYGEALVRTIAMKKEGRASTDAGASMIRSFWKEKGIDPLELRLVDGSGLSPLNRITTHAQVHVLQYARKQSWFSSYLHAFPEYNGMKMKSGTINGVKGYCGYHTSKDGKTYTFSFLVNNYNGNASELVRKMYAVLDILK